MNSRINALFHAVEAASDKILAAERHIWKNPESGYREWKTHAYMKQQFEDLGYRVTEAGNIPGFYADVDTGRPGPTLAIFAEMDSLIVPTHPECDPETGAVHACGHHCQCAAMVGIAAALNAPGALDGLCGRIRLIVVPAEELIEIGYRNKLQKDGVIRYLGGKQEFMARGILDGVDLAIMVHTSTGVGISCNAGSNGCITKEMVITGQSAHAGGHPHKGINALYAANCALNAANALRETFQNSDHIRFHPIITAGGSAVNSIPDRVCLESYVRGASMEAIYRENRKLNRAFAGAAASMGCGLHIHDQHGYAPRSSDKVLQEVFRQVGARLVPEEELGFTDVWSGGCSDMGDVCQVMPAIHPYTGGAVGHSHGDDYYIVDPYLACVVSAKLQVGVAAQLLWQDGAEARRVIENAGSHPTIPDYLATIDKNCFYGEAVTYREDGSVLLTFMN